MFQQNKITTINLFIPLVLKRFFQNIQYKLIYLKIFISFFFIYIFLPCITSYHNQYQFLRKSNFGIKIFKSLKTFIYTLFL